MKVRKEVSFYALLFFKNKLIFLFLLHFQTTFPCLFINIYRYFCILLGFYNYSCFSWYDLKCPSIPLLLVFSVSIIWYIHTASSIPLLSISTKRETRFWSIRRNRSAHLAHPKISCYIGLDQPRRCATSGTICRYFRRS